MGFVGRSELSFLEARFVDAYSQTADLAEAAKMAGYADASSARQALTKSSVSEALALRLDLRITHELWPKAVAVLLELLNDDTVKAATRAAIGMKVLDMRAKIVEDARSSDLRTLTMAELDAAERDYNLLLTAPQVMEPAGVFD